MKYLTEIKNKCKNFLDFKTREKETYSHWEEKAYQGDENSIYKLLMLYYEGKAEWYPTAFKWALMQAKKGSDCGVLFQVAEMYDKGNGTKKDEQQALTWYERALSLHILQGRYSNLSVEVTNHIQQKIRFLREKLNWNSNFN